MLPHRPRPAGADDYPSTRAVSRLFTTAALPRLPECSLPPQGQRIVLHRIVVPFLLRPLARLSSICPASAQHRHTHQPPPPPHTQRLCPNPQRPAAYFSSAARVLSATDHLYRRPVRAQHLPAQTRPLRPPSPARLHALESPPSVVSIRSPLICRHHSPGRFFVAHPQRSAHSDLLHTRPRPSAPLHPHSRSSSPLPLRSGLHLEGSLLSIQGSDHP